MQSIDSIIDSEFNKIYGKNTKPDEISLDVLEEIHPDIQTVKIRQFHDHIPGLVVEFTIKPSDEPDDWDTYDHTIILERDEDYDY